MASITAAIKMANICNASSKLFIFIKKSLQDFTLTGIKNKVVKTHVTPMELESMALALHTTTVFTAN